MVVKCCNKKPWKQMHRNFIAVTFYRSQITANFTYKELKCSFILRLYSNI